MKKFFLLLLFVASTVIVNAQKLSIIDVLTIYAMNADDFDTYASQKGYSFYKVDTSEGFRTAFYASNEKSSGSGDYILTQVIGPKGNAVVYQMRLREDYIEMKEKLKEFGFEYSRSESDSHGSTLIYMKDKIKISLTSSLLKPSGGISQTVYTLSLVVI